MMEDSSDTQFLLSPVESTNLTIGRARDVLGTDNLHHVYNMLIDSAHVWYDFGLALNVHQPTLKQIKSDHGSSDCKACLREMLSHWLQTGQSTTWQDVIQALCSKSVDERRIAEEIAKNIAQSKGLTAPAAQNPRMFSTSEDVSQPTESTQQHSASAPSLGGDYMSIARDGLSKEHRASSTTSMTSLNNPTHAGPIAFPHMLQWNSPCDIRALDKMSSPIDAAVHDDTAYFRPYRSRKIYLYNLTRGWSISADCLVRDTSLVMLPVAYKGAVRFHLHTIGGVKRKIHQQNENEEKFTDAIYQLTDPAHREWIHSISYPKLKTNRSQVTVVLNNDCLIIAGGKSTDGPVNTVDVLTLTCREWHEVASLPYPVYRASGCVCNGMLYILGGYVSPFDPIRSACVATVSQLVESRSNNQSIFNTIKDMEFSDSACVSFRNHILAIGGWKKLGAASTDQPEGTKLVHVYDTSRKIWKELKGQLSEPRCFTFAAAFKDKIMIVGGYDRPNGTCTDSVEFAIIN